MKKNKRYKVLFIILIIYFLVFFCFLGVNNLKEKSHEAILFVGDSTMWKYSGKKWINITNESTIKDLGWKEYHVYQDNKYYGDYYLWYDDSRWYAFKEDKSAVKLEGEFLAYQANYDLNIKSFQTKEITNNTYVHQVLRDNNLKTSERLTVKNIVSADIDNDGINEDFYVISNAFATDYYPKELFSIVFMVQNEQIYPIYTNIGDEKFGNTCKPFIRTFLDINNDNTHEVLVSCGKYSIQKPEDMLFQLTEKEGFKLLISNQ